MRGGVAVVTGGAGRGAGLGQGLVRRLAAQGMRVAILDVDHAAAEALAAELRAEGREAIACAANVLDHATLRAAADQVRTTYGACNVLCAHVGGSAMGPAESMTPDQWREGFELMVVGTMATVQAFLPLMRETKGLRRITITASAAALQPGRFQGPYRVAKAAVTSLGETLDLELGPEGIGTTVIFPSGMMSPPRADGLEPVQLHPDMMSHMTAIAAEMAAYPSDITTGDAAAEPVIDAIVQGRPYVITHGLSVDKGYQRRREAMDEAFAELARRDHLPGG